MSLESTSQLGQIIAQNANDTADVAEAVSPNEDTPQTFRINSETIIVEQGPVKGQVRSISSSTLWDVNYWGADDSKWNESFSSGFIIGSTISGILGTNLLGTPGTSFNTVLVHNDGNRFIDRLNKDTYVDTTNTTATVNVGNVVFSSGDVETMYSDIVAWEPATSSVYRQIEEVSVKVSGEDTENLNVYVHTDSNDWVKVADSVRIAIESGEQLTYKICNSEGMGYFYDDMTLMLDTLTQPNAGTVTDMSKETNNGEYKINAAAYYSFNGNANDESVNSNDGTVIGATLTTDRFGNADNAYYFDGSNDQISIPYQPLLNSAGVVVVNMLDSISGWTDTHRATPVLSDVRVNGDHAMSLVKDQTDVSYAYTDKLGTWNFEDKTLRYWVYIKDQATLDKIDNVRVYFFTVIDQDWAKYQINNANLHTGWNLVILDVENPTSTGGTFDSSDITRMRLSFYLYSASDTTVADDVIFDSIYYGGTFGYFAWVKPMELGKRQGIIDWENYENSGSGTTQHGHLMRIEANDNLYAMIGAGYDGIGVSLTNFAETYLNEYAFVGYTYDGEYLKLYVNGELVDTSDRYVGGMGLGGRNPEEYDLGYSAGWLNGSIDEVIMIKAISDIEVSNLYNTTLTHKLDKPLVTKTDTDGNSITGYESCLSTSDSLGYVQLDDYTPFILGKGTLYFEIKLDAMAVREGDYRNNRASMFGNLGDIHDQCILIENIGFNEGTVDGTLTIQSLIGESDHWYNVIKKGKVHKVLLSMNGDDGIELFIDGESKGVRTNWDMSNKVQFNYIMKGYANIGMTGVLSKPIIFNRILTESERDGLFNGSSYPYELDPKDATVTDVEIIYKLNTVEHTGFPTDWGHWGSI